MGRKHATWYDKKGSIKKGSVQYNRVNQTKVE